ncbi:MAG: hypothetical protein IJ544_08635 [Prevotella sp.]|nr:hypothetical protein [Prevotella sp.]
MKISKTLSSALLQLVSGETVAASLLRKDFTAILLAEGMLTVQVHGSRRSFRAIDASALKNFLQAHYEELRTIGDEMPQSYETRSEQAVGTGNSKLVKARSCPGFPVNSYQPIPCSLNGMPFVVNPPEGSFLFIDNWQRFVIPEDAVVVGIENMENFRMIRLQRQLFEKEIGNVPLLFVSRYPQSADLRKWLQSIPNKYVHFGDFDLAGIDIFLTEFHKYLGDRSTFLVPSDVGQRLAKGSQVRYNNQYDKYHTLRCDIPYLQFLINLINQYHRGYDQEGYIIT